MMKITVMSLFCFGVFFRWKRTLKDLRLFNDIQANSLWVELKPSSGDTLQAPVERRRQGGSEGGERGNNRGGGAIKLGACERADNLPTGFSTTDSASPNALRTTEGRLEGGGSEKEGWQWSKRRGGR